jgi:hypothetical protein
MQTLVAEILAAWRRAERLSESLEPGSADHAAALDASNRLRDLFHDLTSSGVRGPVTEAGARALLEELADSAT